MADTGDEGCMRRAIALARRALAGGDTPVGAVVVRDGQVIAEGIEAVRASLDISAHAEIVAVREACRALGGFDLSDCTLYTTAEPCWMCSFAIRQARVGRVVMGREAGVIGGAGPPHAILLEPAVPGWGPPPEVVRGVLAAECTTPALAAGTSALLAGSARGNGLGHLCSSLPVAETIARIESALAQRHVQLFATIDHAAAAAAVGLQMRPATVLVFGSPRGGTPLMAAAPALAIDLPFKALVWEDEAGVVWVTYNTPEYLAQRHGLAAALAGQLNGLVECLQAAVKS